MTDYVTKDGRHVSVDAPSAPLPPSAALLRDLWREDVDDATWDQWDEAKEVDVHPHKRGRRGTLLFHRKADDTYWGVRFYTENDGDYHTLRDDGANDTDVFRLWPTTQTVTVYASKDPNA